MDLIKWFFRLGGALRPPPADADEKRIIRWRNNVSSTLFVLVVAVTLGDALAIGMIPLFFSGFASASDLNEQVALNKQIRVEQLDTKLYDTRGRQCAAIQNHNSAALQSETQRLQEKLVDYARVAERPYRVPGCDEY